MFTLKVLKALHHKELITQDIFAISIREELLQGINVDQVSILNSLSSDSSLTKRQSCFEIIKILEKEFFECGCLYYCTYNSKGYIDYEVKTNKNYFLKLISYLEETSTSIVAYPNSEKDSL